MASYELSPEAELDLIEIALYTIEHFGVMQASGYRDQLISRCKKIAENPKRYPLVEDVRAGYRRSVCGAHSIYYRERNGSVEIMRIYGQQDPDKI